MGDYIKYIPGIGFVDSLVRLGRAGAKSNVISDRFPQINQGIKAVKDTASDLTKSTRIADSIPGFNQATGIVRSVTGQKPETNNPERPSQPTGGSVVNAFGRSYNMDKPSDVSAYNEAQQKELDRQKGFSPMADIRGGDGLKPDGTRFAQPSGRGETRTNEKGMVQQGTNTGIKPMTLEQANGLLTGGYAIQDPFSSNQLPTTSSSPDQPSTGAGSQVITPDDPIASQAFGQDWVDQHKGTQKSTVITPDDPIAAQAFGQDWVDTHKKEGDPKNSGTNWGARSAADNSDPNIARRRAFLDAEGSMQGLRRAEATQGIVYAGGQHHMLNPNRGQEGQNDFFAIDDKDDVRGYKSGRLSAEDIKSKYVTAITDANKTDGQESIPSNPPVTQEQPAAISPAMLDAPQGFPITSEMKPKHGIDPKNPGAMYR